jgi:hypothetical protein
MEGRRAPTLILKKLYAPREISKDQFEEVFW